MSAKGLFAETLSGVGPDPNTAVQQKNVHLVEPMSSAVSTWRGSGEHVVIHVEQPDLASLVSTQRGSGAYVALTTINYHSTIEAGQTLPFGTRVDPHLALDQSPNSIPPVTPRLSTLPVEPQAAMVALTTPPSLVNTSLLPNLFSLPALQPPRRSNKRQLVGVGLCLMLAGAMAIPTRSRAEAILVPTLAAEPHASHALNAGLVGKIHVQVGDAVAPGQVLVSLDENERSRQAERLRLRIDQLDNELEQLVSTDQRLHSAALGALRKKRSFLVDRLAQHSDEPVVEERRDAELHLRQQLADVDFLRNDRQRSFEQRKRTTEAALSEAHAELLAVNSVELTAKAATAARVSRILVEPGQPVTAGSALVELTPMDAPTKLVGFISDEAVSRVNPLEPVLVDLANMTPTSPRQGLFDARITYVANTPSASEEVQSLLGLPLRKP